MRHSLTAAAKRAKLSSAFHPHDLRHRYVTKLAGEGKSLALVQKAAGHADIRTTMGYTHLTRDDLRALVEPAQTPLAVAVEAR